MDQNIKRILVINPGSTSTKLALFENDQEVQRQELTVRPEEIRHCHLMIEQLDIRMDSILRFIEKADIDIAGLDMIVARGGSIHGVHSGAYWIDAHVDAVLRYCPRSQHVSSLAGIIAWQLSQEYGVPAIFYDAPSADDADDIMHYTGLPEARRFVTSHCLNSKMVAREVAEKLGKPYEQCKFIVAHLGGGITVAFHSGGRMIDTVLDDAGPMSPQRAGRLPVTDVINLCYSGRYTKEEMASKVRGRAGLVAYFGVSDARTVEQMIADGNHKARDIYWYMSYQISKSIAELSVAEYGKIDRIILTGGLAYSKLLTSWIEKRVSFLAPVEVVPGEHEMQALANGGLRVLNGEEQVFRYTWLPEGYDSLKELLDAYQTGKEDK